MRLSLAIPAFLLWVAWLVWLGFAVVDWSPSLGAWRFLGPVFYGVVWRLTVNPFVAGFKARAKRE